LDQVFLTFFELYFFLQFRRNWVSFFFSFDFYGVITFSFYFFLFIR
jgi:hypothetical protein